MMVKVRFTFDDKVFETEMLTDELRLISDIKPKMAFDGDSYKIEEITYSVEMGEFVVWLLGK